MLLNETLDHLNEKLDEIKTYAEMRKNDMPHDIKEKIDAIAKRSLKVIADVVTKVEDTALKVPHDQEFEAFLDQVKEKCDSAVSYTKMKIDEAVELSRHDEMLKDASKKIQDTFDEIRSNDEVKEMVSSIKEVSASIYAQIEDYMSKPETKEVIAKAKVATVNIAEKGVGALKKLLKVEDQDKE